MTEVAVLEVLLGERPIGSLTHLPGDQTLFTLRQDYIEDLHRPTLSLSCKDRFGQLITEIPPVRQRVPAFFANMLPEGALRQYLAQRAGVKPQREFFLLWILGADLPGAVRVQPADASAWPATNLEAKDPQASAQKAREQALRFSLAGVQLKLSAVMEKSGGLTIPVQGIGGAWIVKLPSNTYPGVPQNEYAMLQLAEQVGIEVPETHLVNPTDIANLPSGIQGFAEPALAIKRFDRTADGKRVHIEDFAQVFGLFPEGKYGRASYRNIAEVLALETSERDIAEFIRRLVFNVLIGNQDMHLKNWSLIYRDGRAPSLAPAYDFVYTITYIPDTTAALKFARTKDVTRFSTDELRSLARRAHLSEKLVLQTASETLAKFKDTWPRAKQELPISPATVQAIASHIEQIPMIAELA